jgi:hypothetical protein
MHEGVVKVAPRRADRRFERACREVNAMRRQEPVTKKRNISLRQAIAAVNRYIRGK